MSAAAPVTAAETAAATSSGLNIAVSTHVLNTANGFPAKGIRVIFEAESAPGSNTWTALGEGRTNADGRIASFPAIQTTADEADYRFRFEVAEYFKAEGVEVSFFPEVTIRWRVSQKTDKNRAKLHVPLLISPYGYSSYRGS